MAKEDSIMSTGAFPVGDAGKLTQEAVKGYQEFGGTLIKLEVGQYVEGTYVEKTGYDSEGEGGVLKRVNMYVLESASGVKGKFGGVTQIDDAFDKIKVGQHVKIVRIPDTKSAKKRVVQQFKVYAK